MKKIFKVIGFILLFIVLVFWLSLGIFHIKEYVHGNLYVNYLEKNKTIFNNTFQLDKSFYNHQLFMVGEIHGIAKSPDLDFKLFKHINQKTEVKYYMSEIDFSQAYFLNEYLKTGDEAILHKALKNWLVVQARENKDYYEKWKNLYAYNKGLPEGKKIIILGCDILTDIKLVKQHLKILLDKSTYILLFKNVKNIEELVSNTEQYLSLNNLNSNKELTHLLSTIIQTKKEGREFKIFDNFLSITNLYKIRNEKIYAFYGFAHTLQEQLIDGFKPLAYRIKQSKLPVAKSLVSLNMCFQDSKMILKSESLPFYLKTGPMWSEVSLKYDSLLLFYLKGIKDLKRTSKPNTTTFYKIDNKNSPYKNSHRLMDFTMILPFMKNQTISIPNKTATADFSNYIIFVRNSPAAQPF